MLQESNSTDMLDFDKTVTEKTVPIGWIGLALCIIPFVILDFSSSSLLVYLPFGASVLLFGLPHGAVDHLVPRYLDDYKTSQSVGLVVTTYIILGTIYMSLWFFNPMVALIIFILVTILHWGQGDNYVYTKVLNARYISESRIGSVTGILLKGSFPMIVPLIFHKTEYIAVIDSINKVFGYESKFMSVLHSDSTELFATAFVLLIAGLYIANAVRFGVGKPFRIDLIEMVILTINFYLLTPVYAIGVYFCFWHSIRHIGRLMDADDKLDDYSLAVLIKRFVWVATPMTLGGILTVALVAFATNSLIINQSNLLSIYLVGIAVMTIPHFIIVAWMDKKQRLYEWNSNSKLN